jgi:hypothetical protein
MSFSSLQQFECGGKEGDNLVVSALPQSIIVIEDQERIDVEGSVHFHIEVVAVSTLWTFDIEILGETHTLFSQSDDLSRKR